MCCMQNCKDIFHTLHFSCWHISLMNICIIDPFMGSLLIFASTTRNIKSALMSFLVQHEIRQNRNQSNLLYCSSKNKWTDADCCLVIPFFLSPFFLSSRRNASVSWQLHSSIWSNPHMKAFLQIQYLALLLICIWWTVLFDGVRYYDSSRLKSKVRCIFIPLLHMIEVFSMFS